MERWITQLFEHSDLLRMGHSQRAEDRNLGLGWLYYAMGRIVRPKNVIVVGSYRGFVPLMFAKALQDNLEQGRVTFIDPSMADTFWTDPATVQSYFAEYGIGNVHHFPLTTQQFVETDEYRQLGDVGIVFIDGYHTEEQARFDYCAFESKVSSRGFVLLHDSMVVRNDKVYGEEKAYEMRVKYFVDQLKRDPALQVMDWPFGVSGLTLVRKPDPNMPDPLRDWIEGRP